MKRKKSLVLPSLSVSYSRNVSGVFRLGVLASAVFSPLLASATEARPDVVYDGSDPSMLVKINSYPDPVLFVDNFFSGNRIIVKADITGSVFGGLILRDPDPNSPVSVFDNHVTLERNVKVTAFVMGGESKTGDSFKNTVYLEEGAVASYSVTGGISNSGMAYGNEVNLNGAEAGNILGGSGKGVISHNIVVLKNNSRSGRIIGGNGTGLVSDNVVTLDNSTAEGNVYGGYASYGNTITRNRVVLEGSSTVGTATSSQYVTGGYKQYDRNLGIVTGNEVSLQGTSKVYGKVYGGNTDGVDTVFGNRVIIENNVGISVSDGIFGGFSKKGMVDGNQVIVKDGTVSSTLYGGKSENGSAINNEVVIHSGTEVTGTVYGGFTDTQGAVNGNRISIYGTANLTQATLTGGASGGSGIVQGNVLNVNGFSGAIGKISNFGIINFQNIPVPAGSNAIVSVNDSAGTDLSKTTIRFQNAPGSGTIGEKIVLIENAAGLTTGNQTALSLLKGIARQFNYGLGADATTLSATLNSIQANPETGTFNVSRLANVEFLNQGADFALGAGLDRAVASVDGGKGVGVFGAVSGSESRSDAGGGIAKASGTHYLVGVAGKLNEDKSKDLIAGAYAQAGWGDIADSHGGKDARGDTNYYGIGLIGKLVQKEGAAKGVYGQANLQVGRVKSQFNSNLYNGEGQRGTYDKGSTYYGAGLGVGYLKVLNNDYGIDVSAQYKWLHLDRMDARIAGDAFSFDSINSHRTKLGARLNYTANRQFTPYAGLAWEYESSGKANGLAEGYRMEEQSLKGSSGVAEIGVSFNPSANSLWTVDANVAGVFGQREGVQGRLMVNYRF